MAKKKRKRKVKHSEENADATEAPEPQPEPEEARTEEILEEIPGEAPVDEVEEGAEELPSEDSDEVPDGEPLEASEEASAEVHAETPDEAPVGEAPQEGPPEDGQEDEPVPEDVQEPVLPTPPVPELPEELVIEDEIDLQAVAVPVAPEAQAGEVLKVNIPSPSPETLERLQAIEQDLQVFDVGPSPSALIHPEVLRTLDNISTLSQEVGTCASAHLTLVQPIETQRGVIHIALSALLACPAGRPARHH